MKKRILFIMSLFAVLVASTLTSCKTETPVVDPKNYELSGSITTERTLEAEKTYLLTGPLLIENGGTLNIPAGTTIKAKKGFSYYILVLQGGKINANGTAEKPVVFTAENETGATSGYWGGLIINGKAPLAGGTTGSTEINTAYIYGGTTANDNSGTLKYVVIKYSGARSSADVEHNGLTLNGVGNGTVIENVYILESADDGIELFGGNVNVKNLLVVNSDDDMFDTTQGYKGTIENAYGIWESTYSSSEADPRGVEADGNWDGLTPDQANQSDFVINNMTIDIKLAANTTDKTKQMQDVIKIRRGAKATITNALVKGTGTAQDLVDCTDSKGDAAAGTSVSLTNALSNAIIGSTAKVGVNNATITINPQTANTGCATSLFSWTKYAGF